MLLAILAAVLIGAYLLDQGSAPRHRGKRRGARQQSAPKESKRARARREREDLLGRVQRGEIRGEALRDLYNQGILK